ncbi:hypothetical protein DV736_g923, partial [Chaetothyriales sp. CBS 134916]
MSSPPPSSPPASSAEIVTPSRKVKALLARFDDSGSDDGDNSTQPTTERVVTVGKHETVASTEESDDDAPVVRKSKSRMAARLEGNGHDGRPDRADEPQSTSPNKTMTAAELPSSPPGHGSDDQVPRAAPHRRRLLLNRKRRSVSPSELPHSPASPMFFPSPSANRDGRSSSPPCHDSDSDLPDDPISSSKERFHALVEKHRKMRREREAAEAAKKNDREKTRSEALAEESDGSAESEGRKLSQATKPTRKASKKAREEMARETQRMSRNMQLAHQARTRKNFSKDSFLAIFNRSLPTTPATHQQPQSDSRSGPESPHASSDVEHGRHTTPPTSPPPVPPNCEKLNPLIVSDGLVLEAPRLQNLEPLSLTNNGKGKGRALENATNQYDAVPPAPPTKRARLRELLNKSLSDSKDADLEVITARGEWPKYAAFEKLPSRTAAEPQSHRVLRALAHIHDPGKNSRSSMNMAELDLSLQRAARLQAKEERQQKIDVLRAMGKSIRTAEERERDQEEVEDLVEKARQEAAQLQKREKELAKKDGTYVKDGIDKLIDDAAEEADSENGEPLAEAHEEHLDSVDEELNARKPIPGLNMSDDLPMDLSQAFAATMADSQTQSNGRAGEEDSYDMVQEVPSPGVALMPQLNRLDSLDIVTNSQPSQIQPVDMDLSLSQAQHVPASPLVTRERSQSQFTPSRALFEPTQDRGYVYSPFEGNRFETPQQVAPHSTRDTVILSSNVDASPLVQRKRRLRHGRVAEAESEEEDEASDGADKSAFVVMKHAAKKAEQQAFDKSKSNAREIVDEAAQESDDEYAGLGGASDDEEGVENEDDRRMIDNNTEIDQGDEAKLAGHFADRERKEDEAAVNKLMKDLATGALRRKRGAQDDLDLSDDEVEAAARRRKAKQRQFARMQRELLKDEAVGKIAEDKKKEAFLKSIEDREPLSDDDLDWDQFETPVEEWQSQSQPPTDVDVDNTQAGDRYERPLETVSDSQLNHGPASVRRSNHNKKPNTLAQIRESVSFLIEEPESQASLVDLGLSDSEEEPEAYVDLDRHLRVAEADENAPEDGDGDGLADFIVQDNRPGKDVQGSTDVQKPGFSSRQPFSERRTRVNVVNRVSLLRQSASTGSHSGSPTTKMAFYTSTTTFKGPTLLRRATTNSALTSFSTNEGVSATGVTVAKTERGSASEEKEFIRKGKGGVRNAVNYQGPATGAKGRLTVREERMSARAGVVKRDAAKGRKGHSGFLGGLFGMGAWE